MVSIVIAWAAGVVRILWVCRVSLVDALVGLLFFGLLVQAQNLMADLSSMGSGAEYVFWAGVFGFTFLLWAFPVHYGARRSLDALTWPGRSRAGLGWLVLGLPRVLGVMPFFALALGIRGAIEAVQGAAHILPAADATIAQGFWLYVADAVAGTIFALFVTVRKDLIPDDWDGKILHPLALVATALLFAIAYVAPIYASVHIPRALLVPPLFGSLVLGASWLTRLGDRTGFPFLATVAVILGVLTGLNKDFNMLRSLSPGQADQRLTMDAAIKAWKAANNCTTQCPRPLVIAIDGGASRAAFTAATFVGELLDRIPKPDPNEAQSPGRRIFAISGVSGGSYGAAVIQAALVDAQRSGHGLTPPCQSAQTTWFGYGDWHAGDKSFNWRQCLQTLTSGDYLSSTIIGLAFRDLAAPPWQQINLPAMPDRAALLEMTWERQYAATLQKGEHFFEQGAPCEGEDDNGFCRRMAHPAALLASPSRSPLWMPLLLLNGTSVATGRRIVSADLASTKVIDGDPPTGGSLYSQAFDLREIMSDQCPLKPPPISAVGPEAARLLARASATDKVARTLSEGVCSQADAPIDGPDVRLSTAALTSARFPIISPAGVFEMKGTIFGDQVVDGGYFENSGLTTALEIVQALKLQTVDATLISISNNPAYDPATPNQLKACEGRFKHLNGNAAGFSRATCTGLPRRPVMTPLVGPEYNTFLGRFFSLFYRPLQTLVATGDGHADEVMARIEARPPTGGFYHLQVEVAPDFDLNSSEEACRAVALKVAHKMALENKKLVMAKVSMSWWLAAAVQADLDIQRCSTKNQDQLAKIDGALKERITLH
jgi:hypothetical protein